MNLSLAPPSRHLLEEEPAEDVQGLTKQLLACRAALRLQMQRSQQLVAAYNAKLHATNAKLKEAEEFSQKRFAYLARAVMGAEASLRRKQKEIMQQLSVKDELITEQRTKLEQLCKETPKTVSPPVPAPRKPLAPINNKPPTPYKPPGLTLSLPPQYKKKPHLEKLEKLPEEENQPQSKIAPSANQENPCEPMRTLPSPASSTETLTASPATPIDHFHDNFEEFHLDSENNSDENDEGILNRKSGDGAERQQLVLKAVACSQGSYEGFLEATGLSQKSILTPSRLNSHRSVLKPRDIKFRSKANRTFCNGAVKYWSGPFL
ncbi:uncharacterized protein LOC132200230 [Neocloeon triangulifer]|uniref:uncharacterized protein LOC132200230 n=1 Tax=Neocloeon triangulifer TaxID=2078957 RepID=UPI00286F2F35|nr:uncharacterized protein LOC132200230 [Neocloeon triangulifer]